MNAAYFYGFFMKSCKGKEKDKTDEVHSGLGGVLTQLTPAVQAVGWLTFLFCH